MQNREEIFASNKIILIPKPEAEDLAQMQDGSVVWGWPHCVQQEEITQLAIDKKLTLIAWEVMNVWTQSGEWKSHIFYKNNEIAGYAGVHHALSLVGQDGFYGPAKSAVVINFGSVSRGAIYGLQSRGLKNITVYTLMAPEDVATQVLGVEYKQIVASNEGDVFAIQPDSTKTLFVDEIASADVIVNGILQDTDAPLMFVQKGQEAKLKTGALIVDISCDEEMGFAFAKPTSFKNPLLRINNSLDYYAVDHTPSYFWNSCSWELSRALLPYLETVLNGEESWNECETIRRAIEILNGTILNSKIMNFQSREATYPHRVKDK